MNGNRIYIDLLEAKNKGRKWLAVLIDPEEIKSKEELLNLLGLCAYSNINLLFVGGSIVTPSKMNQTLLWIKENTKIPVILFPGSSVQVNENADAILFLSLISGRNAELLIGEQVLAAPMLEKTKLEIIPCGYLLIDTGKPTSVAYVSQTIPIPANKPEIAAYTALAGEMLGLKTIYLEAGSGADTHVTLSMIKEVRNKISVPLIVGGGINSRKKIEEVWDAGADIVVIGTAIENNTNWLIENNIAELQTGN